MAVPVLRVSGFAAGLTTLRDATGNDGKMAEGSLFPSNSLSARKMIQQEQEGFRVHYRLRLSFSRRVRASAARYL